MYLYLQVFLSLQPLLVHERLHSEHHFISDLRYLLVKATNHVADNHTRGSSALAYDDSHLGGEVSKTRPQPRDQGRLCRGLAGHGTSQARVGHAVVEVVSAGVRCLLCVMRGF